MNSEATKFLEEVFASNNITLPSIPPIELYEILICKNIHNITNKEFLPLKSLLEFIHDSKDLNGNEWDYVALHPDININIIKEYWAHIDFKLLVKNKDVDRDLLCQLLIDLETSGELSGKELDNNWQFILKNGIFMMDIDLYFKYPGKFKVCKESIEYIDVDNINNTNITDIDKIKFFDKFIYGSGEVDMFHAISCILDFSFKHYNLLIALKKTFKRNKDVWTAPAIKKSMFNYKLVIDKYFNIYEKEPAFIHLLRDFYEVLSAVGFHNLECLNQVIINKLTQKSNIFTHDLKYLINKKIITILPSNPVKYKDHANYLFQEYINGNIKGYRPTKRGQYTFKQFKKLMCHSDLSKFNGIFHFEDIKFYIEDIKFCNKSNYYSNNNDGVTIQRKFKKSTEKFDLHTLNDIYKNIVRYSDNTILCAYIMKIYLYPTIFNNFSIFKSRHTFKEILEEGLLSSSELEFILENVQLRQHEKGLVSINSNLTPYLINKYNSKLDWNVLKFNAVWLKHPHTDFNKLPVFDDDNFWLWATPLEKIKKIEEFRLKFPFKLIGDEYIELEFENEHFFTKKYPENEEYPGKFNLPMANFHPITKCKNNCTVCNYYGICMMYHHKAKNKKIKAHSETISKMMFFLPTLKLSCDNNHIHHIIYINDFSRIV
jgi:hypothetical protein